MIIAEIKHSINPIIRHHKDMDNNPINMSIKRFWRPLKLSALFTTSIVRLLDVLQTQEGGNKDDRCLYLKHEGLP